MRFDTALREQARRLIRRVGRADLVVGIPCYNSEASIGHVVRTVAAGLRQHFPQRTAVIVVSDGGSLDDTREVARAIPVEAPVHRIVTIYRGLPGKGTSLRAVFEATERLQAKACAVFDSDLQSITPSWVPALLRPALDQGYDFVSPYYVRHKWDGTITNNIARALVQALYGKRIRQPIGGDFGFSARLVAWFTRADVWEGDIARFGIDIWMTTVAICEGFEVCEAFLGAKVHDAKDPAASLGPMFRQVVGTLFGMMSRYEALWRRPKRSTTVPLLGERVEVEPPEVKISLERLTESFRAGFDHFGSLWRDVLGPEQFAALEGLKRAADEDYRLEARAWARIVYDFVATFHRWTKDRYKLVETMTPIYYARIAAFVVATRRLTTAEADALVDAQADTFEAELPYLLARMAAPVTAPKP